MRTRPFVFLLQVKLVHPLLDFQTAPTSLKAPSCSQFSSWHIPQHWPGVGGTNCWPWKQFKFNFQAYNSYFIQSTFPQKVTQGLTSFFSTTPFCFKHLYSLQGSASDFHSELTWWNELVKSRGLHSYMLEYLVNCLSIFAFSSDETRTASILVNNFF